MIYLVIFLLVLLVFFLYILFAPFYVEINTPKRFFGIKFHYLASARLIVSDDSLMIEIRAVGWTFPIDLFARKERKEKRVVKKQQKGKWKMPFSNIKAVIRSFKVNTCYVNLDLEDVIWNAKLFPVFFGLRCVTGRFFNINFIGENEIRLEIENNMARILWAFMKK